MLLDHESCLYKERTEFTEGESMIVAIVCSDFYLVFSFTCLRGIIFFLITEIPVRHVDSTIGSEEFSRIEEDLESICARMDVME